jgi:membrane associated rhomboid family serine protease
MLFPIKVTQPSYSRPLVTVSLIVANVLAFLHQWSLDPYSLHQYIADYGLRPNPHYFHFANIFTAMFVHANFVHVGGNMLFLWVFGDNVEDILGHGKFLLFYLLCGLTAALAQMASNPLSIVPMVGASGAIAGVMGAYLVKFPHSRIVTLVFLFVFMTTIEVPAVLILVYWFVIQIFSGVGSIGHSQLSQGGVAWFAHVGGFLAGMVLMLLMGRGERYRRRRDLSW